MSEQKRPSKGEHDAVTGNLNVIPVSDEEWEEIKAKQAHVKAELEAQAAAEIAAKAEADSAKEIVDARLTSDDIKNSKTIAELKDLILRQNAAINVVLKKLDYIV